VGSNPAVYWMDVSDASYYMNERGNIGSQMGHTKKYLKKFLFDNLKYISQQLSI
jgi:hypothetical protein